MIGTQMDLLKQATHSIMSSRHDEHNDSDTSNRTLQSGMATPHPDLADKRFPGILHNYFGQVCFGSSTFTSPGLHDSSALNLPPENLVSLNNQEKSSSSELLSLVATDSTGEHEGSDGLAYTAEKLHIMDNNPYPTPPVSHKNSLRYLKCTSTSIEENNPTNSTNEGLSSLKFSTLSENTPESLPSTVRKISMAPSTSTITPLHISALMSNPTLGCKSVSPGPSSYSCITPESHCFHSLNKLKQLTECPVEKLISESPSRSSSRTDHSALSLSSEAVNYRPEPIPPDTIEIGPTPSQTPVTPATAPAAKGRLVVQIIEARGLRRSRDPYVVAVFQRNELVSKGPLPQGEYIDEKQESSLTTGGQAVSRSASDSGKPMAIPMKSRQSSNTSISDHRDFKNPRKSTINPHWGTKAVFDVVGSDCSILLTVYDRGTATEEFLGQVELQANLAERENSPIKGWFRLHGRNDNENTNTGEIHVEMKYQPTEVKHYGPEDFQILKLIGKGTFGQVYQVRKKDTQRIYAMKVLQKKVIVQKKEVAHTVGERNILVRTAMAESPFIVGLKFSFQTPTDLYLVTDYMSGGELFWHLQKEGRFDEKRAKFYIAELILALQHLHMHDIVYRDLKPENILLDANGHIALCDFGLSKANLTKNETTNTFCGTTEYLAPEVLLDESGYTKMVDFWSLGVLVFEMCCGWSPFYAEDTQQMYKNIAFGKVRFPRDTLTTEGRNFVKGLLNRNPKHRLGAIDDAEELKRHPLFADIDWDLLAAKKITPLFKPKLESETDTSNFDPEFTNALNGNGSLNARAAALAAGIATSTPLSPGVQANFKGFTFVERSLMEDHMAGCSSTLDDWEVTDDYERGYEKDNFSDNINQIYGNGHTSGVTREPYAEDQDCTMFTHENFDS
ncbi:Serine/threonine-protein kinase SCH9 [Golovinomyces cichoracearum]|uniref:non-specific serine/threonine protein kinase n=1 Tax=Golovinomyces cichoracearum TaxID=62708 RepID=A0A420HM79_9PEZI|nr:Serine/threonine-protein kinase SCH9 [Golovinomyces cichoracearum]